MTVISYLVSRLGHILQILKENDAPVVTSILRKLKTLFMKSNASTSCYQFELTISISK